MPARLDCEEAGLELKLPVAPTNFARQTPQTDANIWTKSGK